MGFVSQTHPDVRRFASHVQNAPRASWSSVDLARAAGRAAAGAATPPDTATPGKAKGPFFRSGKTSLQRRRFRAAKPVSRALLDVVDAAHGGNLAAASGRNLLLWFWRVWEVERVAFRGALRSSKKCAAAPR